MSHTALLDADRYFAKYGLTPERLALAKPDAIVMHPQPMNRGIEIASDVADGPRSVIRHQVRNGVATRMAVLEAVVELESAQRMSQEHRGTIFLEDARVLRQTPFAGDQYVIRLHAPQCARVPSREASPTSRATRPCRCDGRCRSCAWMPMPAG